MKLQEFLELEVDIQKFFSSGAKKSKNALLAWNFENRYPTYPIPSDIESKF